MTVPASAPHSAPPAPDGWRDRLLQGLLVTTLVLETLGAPVIMVQTESYRDPFWLTVTVIVLTQVYVATLWRSLPYTYRAVALLLGIGAVPLLGLLRVGYQVGPGIGCALVVCLSGLLLGRLALGGAFALTLAGFAFAAFYTHHTGGAFLAPGVNDPTKLSNWFRVATSYVLFTGVGVTAVTFVVRHIEAALEERTRAFESLRAEKTQRQQAENALGAAQDTILQMQKLEAVGRLAGGVAHDFNNALVVILGWADLLRAQAKDDSLRRGLDEIALAGSRASRLTQQLLAFGRKAVSVPALLAPGDVVGEAARMLGRLMPESIRLAVEVEPGLPTILADAGQLQQVLINLCLNARDAMPAGGELRLRAGLATSTDESAAIPVGNWVTLSVLDSGTGMDEATRLRAFEPFFTTKGKLGSGLGLAMAYGIVQQCGGHITIRTELGRGSTFTVWLPPGVAPGDAATAPELERVAVQGRGTVLLAEDEPAVRELMVTVLRDAGLEVIAAEDGASALDLARRHRGKIDLLCTDGVMPGMSSSDLITGFRRLFPESPVLVCSGHVREQALREGVAHHDLGYLEKPFTSSELVGAVVAALERRA